MKILGLHYYDVDKEMITFNVNRNLYDYFSSTPPNYGDVNSRELMVEKYQQGQLEAIYLFPIQLGGEEVELNTVYVPIGVSAMKDKIDNTFINYAHEGLINKLKVKPVYKGNSFIPSKIVYEGSHSNRDGNISLELDIW
ncbi:MULTISPECIES: hypothetical protein [unclassified Acinetobacter]|uniref:hypothetical protein n=1 Tax=unclassified Acinetobacter TaxID=196816 RepID=UPI0035BAD247